MDKQLITQGLGLWVPDSGWGVIFALVGLALYLGRRYGDALIGRQDEAHKLALTDKAALESERARELAELRAEMATLRASTSADLKAQLAEVERSEETYRKLAHDRASEIMRLREEVYKLRTDKARYRKEREHYRKIAQDAAQHVKQAGDNSGAHQLLDEVSEADEATSLVRDSSPDEEDDHDSK